MYLVTGGAGYFGECLVKCLLDQGQRVRVFDLNPLEGFGGRVEGIQGDVRDYDAIRRACEGVTVVMHNVAQVPLAKNRHLFESVNQTGTENTLRAALEAGAKKFVNTSSSAIFGVPEKNPIRETDTPMPAEDYGRAKLRAEDLCHAYVQKGLDVSIVRPRTIVGHGRLGIFQILFEWVHQGYNVPVFDGGKNMYQFVHADDLASACILAAQSAGPDVFNVGAERFGTMREALEELCRHAGTGSKVRSLPMWPMQVLMNVTSKLGLSPLGPYHSLMYGRSMFFDVTKAKTKLGWQPKYSNSEMINQSYDWYVAHHREIMKAANLSAHRSAVKQGILQLLPRLL